MIFFSLQFYFAFYIVFLALDIFHFVMYFYVFFMTTFSGLAYLLSSSTEIRIYFILIYCMFKFHYKCRRDHFSSLRMNDCHPSSEVISNQALANSR